MNGRSRRNILLAMICSMFTIVMCRCYDESLGSVELSNGWTCKAYTDYDFGGSSGFECTGTCPNGNRVGPLDVADLSQLETRVIPIVCGVSTLTPTVISSSPTATESQGEAGDPRATLTSTSTPLPLPPLLTGELTSCSIASGRVKWINLRFAEPRLDLSGKTLDVQIGGSPSICGTNQGNVSLLTCFPASNVTYPANVIVKVDGVEINNFTINPSTAICNIQPTATKDFTVDASETPATPGTP